MHSCILTKLDSFRFARWICPIAPRIPLHFSKISWIDLARLVFYTNSKAVIHFHSFEKKKRKINWFCIVEVVQTLKYVPLTTKHSLFRFWNRSLDVGLSIARISFLIHPSFAALVWPWSLFKNVNSNKKSYLIELKCFSSLPKSPQRKK
jgi:hypothetical protein